MAYCPLSHVERYYVHELSERDYVECSVMVGVVHSSSCVLHCTQESYPLKSPPKILNAELKFE